MAYKKDYDPKDFKVYGFNKSNERISMYWFELVELLNEIPSFELENDLKTLSMHVIKILAEKNVIPDRYYLSFKEREREQKEIEEDLIRQTYERR